jgi:Zn-dependent peptidase ImmA (M78 family)
MATSRTEQYFLNLFGVSSVSVAAERAADFLRANAGPDASMLPVDVFKLAEAKGMKIQQDLEGAGCAEGMLIPRKDDYLVRLRRDVPSARKRFSLAHELGHTFFYKNEGTGPRHAIGIMDRTEHLAEERVCNQFAGFLLMPTDELQRRFGGLEECHPSDLLDRLESTSGLFSVSKEALTRHAEALGLSSPPWLVLQSSFRATPRGSQDKHLRMDWCAAIGNWGSPRRLWRHYRLSAIGLTSACDLYDNWRTIEARGTFMFNGDGSLVRNCAATKVCAERIAVSVSVGGKWAPAKEPYLSASRLYTWNTTNGAIEAYVVTVLTPSQGARVEKPR